MTGTRQSNGRASRSGARAESVARRRVNGTVNGIARKQAPTVAGRLDGTHNGKPLEVKSCERWVKGGGGRRAGRWWFSRKQHTALVRAGGSYALVVQDGGRTVSSRIVAAGAIPVPSSGAQAWTVGHTALSAR